MADDPPEFCNISPPVSVPALPSWVQPSANAAEDFILFVKFVDSAKVRTNSGTTYSLTGWNIGDAITIALAEDAAFSQVLGDNECEGLDTLLTAGEQRTGQPARDLAGIHRVEFSANKTVEEIVDLGNNLLALPEVELAEMVSRHPSPPPGSTPDLRSEQDYVQSDPGANFLYANDTIGLSGNGIRITEMSLAWDRFHEDLSPLAVSIEVGQDVIGFDDISDFNWDHDLLRLWIDHGSATLGMLFALDNAYGTSGLTPDAEGHLYPMWDTNTSGLIDRRHVAYCNALVDSINDGFGNILYFEYQEGVISFMPAETLLTMWELTRAGVNAGVIIIQAAGNGDFDLATHSALDKWRECGDSGAMIIGSGTADKNHDKYITSNYGQRVYPHAWGEGIVTLGCGDRYGGDTNPATGGWQWWCPLAGYESTQHERYTDHFGGTSGATVMVAAAAALLQEHTIAQGLSPLDSVDMRSLLTHTGIPQGTAVSGHIGPFINVKEAIQNFDIADLAVQTNQVGNTPFTTFIANQGPRVARDVEVEIVYGLWFGETLTAIDIPDGCEWFSYPPGTQCPGSFCPPKLVCTFDRIEPNQPMEITLNYCGDPAQGGQGTMQVDTQALMNGELTDDNLANNVDVSTVDNGKSCGIAQ